MVRQQRPLSVEMFLLEQQSFNAEDVVDTSCCTGEVAIVYCVLDATPIMNPMIEITIPLVDRLSEEMTLPA